VYLSHLPSRSLAVSLSILKPRRKLRHRAVDESFQVVVQESRRCSYRTAATHIESTLPPATLESPDTKRRKEGLP
jgi:hypothetical protein